VAVFSKYAKTAFGGIMDFDDDYQILNDINNLVEYPPEMLEAFPNNIHYHDYMDWVIDEVDLPHDSVNSIPLRKSRQQIERERAIEREKDLALYGRAYVRKRDNANKMFAGLGLDGFIENYGIVAICAVVFFLLFTPI